MSTVQAATAGTSSVPTQTTSNTSAAAPTNASTGQTQTPNTTDTSAASSSTAVTVHSQVAMMLGAIDSAMAGNEILKMAITLLILEVLMGQDSEESHNSGAQMMATLGGQNSQGESFYYSEMTTVEITTNGSDSQSMQNITASTGDNVDATA